MLRSATTTEVLTYYCYSSVNINDGFSIKSYTEIRDFKFDCYSLNGIKFIVSSQFIIYTNSFLFQCHILMSERSILYCRILIRSGEILD